MIHFIDTNVYCPKNKSVKHLMKLKAIQAKLWLKLIQGLWKNQILLTIQLPCVLLSPVLYPGRVWPANSMETFHRIPIQCSSCLTFPRMSQMMLKLLNVPKMNVIQLKRMEKMRFVNHMCTLCRIKKICTRRIKTPEM